MVGGKVPAELFVVIRATAVQQKLPSSLLPHSTHVQEDAGPPSVAAAATAVAAAAAIRRGVEKLLKADVNRPGRKLASFRNCDEKDEDGSCDVRAHVTEGMDSGW